MEELGSGMSCCWIELSLIQGTSTILYQTEDRKEEKNEEEEPRVGDQLLTEGWLVSSLPDYAWVQEVETREKGTEKRGKREISNFGSRLILIN